MIIDKIIPNRISKYFRRWRYDRRYHRKFYELHGYELNEDSPSTFSEKIFYRKKYGNFDAMALYSDKYAVREYVKSVIGAEYLVPLLGVYTKLTIEDLDNLPNKFVVKTTHGSGKRHIEIVRDKSSHNLLALVKKMNHALTLDFGYARRELWYTKIPKKIIIEEFLESGTDTPDDYKFHCFAGTELYIAVDEGRFEHHKRSVFNAEWELTDIRLNSFMPIGLRAKPDNFDLMKKLVRKLATGFDYIRVDIYSVNGKIYFGEFTHAPANGMEQLKPDSMNELWGKLWEIDPQNEHLYLNK